MKKMMLSATVLAIALGLSGCIWPGPHHHPHHSSGDNRGPQMQDNHRGNSQDNMRR